MRGRAARPGAPAVSATGASHHPVRRPGCRPARNHGSDDPRDITIPWIAWGKGVKTGELDDASVRTISYNVDMNLLQNMGTMAGGESGVVP